MTYKTMMEQLPSIKDVEKVMRERAKSCPSTAYLIKAYETGVMFSDEEGPVELNNTSASWNEARWLWYLAYNQSSRTILETGFGRGGSAAVLLAGSSTVGARVVSIDPAFRHWAGDTGLKYLHHAQSIHRHILVEEPSELFLATKIVDPTFEKLQLAYIDGSHLYDIALVDFVLLDRLVETGGIIAIDDAMSPAVLSLLSFIANNRAYKVCFPTPRLAVCFKVGDDDRSWDYFRPFWVSPNSDWDVHGGLPTKDIIPDLKLASELT